MFSLGLGWGPCLKPCKIIWNPRCLWDGHSNLRPFLYGNVQVEIICQHIWCCFAFVGTVFAQHFYATNPAASFKHMFAGLLCPRSGLFVSFIPHLVSECSWLFCLNKSANLFYIFSSKSTYIFLVNQPRKLMGYRNQGVSWGFSHHFFSVTATSQDRPGHWDRGPLARQVPSGTHGKSRVLEWEPLTASKQHDIPIYSVWQSPEMVVYGFQDGSIW